MNGYNEYVKDLLETIKDKFIGRTMESNLHLQLEGKYGYRSSMFFNDAIRELEHNGSIIRMNEDGVIFWWESDK